ncbi:MAG: MFS transporter [Lachnospiraceae bacterium]|nr:MFS transporter [Lachnospiraceae bacterium]
MKYRPTIHFCVIQGLYWGCFCIVYAYASVYLLAKGLTSSQIGYLIAAGSGLSVILQPILGAMADRSKKPILHKLTVIMFAIMIACYVGLLVVDVKVSKVVFYGVLIILLQATTSLTYSLGLFFMDMGLKVNIGIARGMGSLFYAAISSALGVLVVKFNEDVVLMAGIIGLTLLSLSILTFHFKGVEEVKLVDEAKKERTNLSLAEFLVSHKRYSGVLLGNIFVFIAYNFLNSYMFQIVTHHGGTEKEMGFAISLGAFLELPILFTLTFVNRKFKSGFLFKVSSVVILLKCIMFMTAMNINMIYVAMFTQALGYGLYAGISIYYIAHTIENEEQVRGQSLMTATVTIGMLVGSGVGGLLIDKGSVPLLLTVTVITAVIGAVIVCISAEKGKTQGKAEEA